MEREYPEFFRPLSAPLSRRFSQRAQSYNSFASLANSFSSIREDSSGDHARGTSISSNSSVASSSNQNSAAEGQLRYWTAEMCTRTPQLFDYVVTLGGDGTVLFASWLFQRIVPPLIPFALGSLGFLTPFDFADYEKVMGNAINHGVRVNLRMRFTCTVFRATDLDLQMATAAGLNAGDGDDQQSQQKKRRAIRSARTGEILMAELNEKGGWEALERGKKVDISPEGEGDDKDIMCFSTRPVETFEVLNDLVVDRGPSPYVSLLELFGKPAQVMDLQTSKRG